MKSLNLLLIFIASLSKQRCSLLGHGVDISGPAAARAVAASRCVLSTDSAGDGQHGLTMGVVKTGLGVTAQCRGMNKTALG